MAASHTLRGFLNWFTCMLALAVIGTFHPEGFLRAEETVGGSEFTDAKIVEALEWDLLLDDGVDSRRIDLTADEGIVTLSGSVGNLLAKERAVEIAQRLKGVRAVVDLLEVSPVLRTDQEIQAWIEQALIDDPATESFEIGVSVQAGVVTLTGTVESWQERMLSEEVAKGIRGVREVVNEIEVRYPKDRPDSEIRADVTGRLRSDVWVEAPLVTVEVEDGIVTLSGTVGSAAEKRQATADSWVAGVTEVRADDLKVHPGMKLSGLREEVPLSISDRELQRSVQAALSRDPRVRSFGIAVHVRHGLVTLGGEVDNLAARRAASVDAANTLGVRRVKNTIKVRPEDPPTDEELAQKVRQTMDRNPYLEFYEIFTAVSHGSVYLYGEVDSAFELRLAGRLTEGIKGVTDVVNLLHVNPSWLSRSDWELEQDIESKLRWNAYVDDEGIRVEVDDAIATLTGMVETMRDKIAAGRSALTAGPKQVRNNLVIRSDPEPH